MFSQIVGYSTLKGENEQKVMKQPKNNHQLDQLLIDYYHKKILKERGDGILEVFVAASDTIHSAQEILKISKGENPESILQKRIRLGKRHFY